MVTFGSESKIISYCLLEFCPNGDLHQYLKKTGGFEENISKFLFTQIASALQFMHNNGYAHLDIKPQNILLDENFNVKLADFGTAECCTHSPL